MKAPGTYTKTSSFGPDGRRLRPSLGSATKIKPVQKPFVTSPTKCNLVTPPKPSTSCDLFSPGNRIIVQRAPILCGLSINPSLRKKFQRPMTGRRAYDKQAEHALKKASLGQRRRMDGMSKLMARAGRGLSYKLPSRSCEDGSGGSDSEEEEEEEEEKPKEMVFEPLCVWRSPDDGGEAKGLPPRVVTEMQNDEYGIESAVQVERPAPASAYSKKSAYVPPLLARWLRPHQREGVSFLYECTMSLRSFRGNGCILADDMGLGKTLQSITLLYTLLKTSITANNAPTVKRVIIVCPCSLVKNWDNEIIKWIADGGPGPLPGVTPPRVMALAECDRAEVEKNIDSFCRTNLYSVLIVSYETLRTHVSRLTSYSESKCDLLICDEAHRLKNRDNQTTRALNSIPCKRRVLLTGTPMQNDLEEFYAMVDFTNPGILGSPEQFRKSYLFPILRGREPDAADRQKARMMECQRQLSEIVNEFILRRVNTVNAQHLPPKLVQVVNCSLTDVQKNMYEYLLAKMEKGNVLEGKKSNCLGWIQCLMKLANHPSLIANEDPSNAIGGGGGRRGGKNKVKYNEQGEGAMSESLNGVSRFLPLAGGSEGGTGFGRRNINHAPVHPEWSGKMFVLYRLMTEMRKPYCRDKIVIVSNYTQTLDLIGRMCTENSWGFCRLDGSIGMKKRQKMVDEFNDPHGNLVAFLLSSKAGGCGLNLIGGNRLVLFDPDWNPAVDKQAAARCWRDGQKKRCFTYRFLATGTVEEKIFQRQLAKEGLQSVVDDKDQCNALSSKDLRNLFKLRTTTPSDTHDKLNCQRCATISDDHEMDLAEKLPLQLAKCRELLKQLMEHEDSSQFLSPLVFTCNDTNNTEEEKKEVVGEIDGVSKEQYERYVRQPIDLRTILKTLSHPNQKEHGYKSVSCFSRDVNRIFNNVLKVWSPGQEIADAARRLQAIWMKEWTELVPKLMNIECEPCTSIDEEKKELTQVSSINTRGQDFQEQIGMPDEENMRSWSHHHTIDTVDDPVFRTAMKGYDNVSFVFGLEVTWSLIQQRNQEEEERAAMEEFERMQQLESECGEEEEVGETPSEEALSEREDSLLELELSNVSQPKSSNNQSLEDESCVKSTRQDCDEGEASSPPSAEEMEEDPDEEWNLIQIYSQAQILQSPTQCATDGCQFSACSIWKSSSGTDWNSCLDCQRKDFGNWPNEMKPSDKLLECIIANCSANATVTDKGAPNSNQDSNAQPLDLPASIDLKMDDEFTETLDKVMSTPEKKKKAEWSCEQCTLLNKPFARKCKACGCKKSPSPAKKSPTKKRQFDQVK